MPKYNKNISAVILTICIASVFIALFRPKEYKKTDEISTSNSHFSINSFPKTSKLSVKNEKIYLIRLEGVISDSPPSSIFKDLTSSSSVLELIRSAAKDESIKAIVLRINSPGGTVAASQELYNALINARKKKPVVITMGDIAASGGYYIASASNAIFANPGTLTGSIGVITSYVNFHELFSKIGLEGVTIKAGKYKDIGNAARPMTEEERKILQTILDDSYNQFLSDVSKGRNMPMEKLKNIAQGLIYTGRQAKKVGLVDYLGDDNRAIRHAQKLAKERFPELARKYKNKDIPTEESWKSASFIDILLSSSMQRFSTNTETLNNKLFKTYSYSKFQPLWLLE